MPESKEEFIASDLPSPGGHPGQLTEDPDGTGDGIGGTVDPHPSVTAGDAHSKLLLHAAEKPLVTRMVGLQGAGILEIKRGRCAVA
jgi:hypothetical protein